MRERAALREAGRLLRERFGALEVVLFGSRARGEGDAESDLDLLVVTTRSLDWRERRALVDALFEIELQHALTHFSATPQCRSSIFNPSP